MPPVNEGGFLLSAPMDPIKATIYLPFGPGGQTIIMSDPDMTPAEWKQVAEDILRQVDTAFSDAKEVE